MPRMIFVSQQDIDMAMHGNGRFCPVAVALHRQGYTDPTVTKNGCRFPSGVTVELPPEALSRIDAWDKGLTIRPFGFEMNGRERWS